MPARVQSVAAPSVLPWYARMLRRKMRVSAANVTLTATPVTSRPTTMWIALRCCCVVMPSTLGIRRPARERSRSYDLRTSPL
ncbi:hypothetical protein GCM10010170_105330 [Dactylosporangium salmoneum]|uniref:Uncharacterized protein n=1 Tax=Dactylosporangium salmoneum TaxID=53361 RepID=A0ABP5V1W9_9ACTN